MTQTPDPDRSGIAPAPRTRRELRERERAIAATQQRAAAAPEQGAGSSVQLVQGTSPIYTSRRDLREQAKLRASALDVQQLRAPAVDVDTPVAPLRWHDEQRLPVSPSEPAALSTRSGIGRPPTPPLSGPIPVQRSSKPAEANATSPQHGSPLGVRASASTPIDVERLRQADARRAASRRTVAASSRARALALVEHRPRRVRAAIRKASAVGVMLVVGAFVVVTSVPAQAFSGGEAFFASTSAALDGDVTQAVDVAGSTQTLAGVENFTVNDALANARLSAADLASLQTIADGETAGSSYGGTPAFPKTWAALKTDYTQSPFPSIPEVRVSSGFGYRTGGFHGGVDLTPGAGTEIHPIANGVVSEVWQGNNPGGGGYTVFIDHNINGQFFQSWYGHMQAGSIAVEVGDVVTVDTLVGRVGNSGTSTGAHLHLEIKNSDYVSFDPLLWLSSKEEVLEPSN